MTTDASDFDGTTVAYTCNRNPDGTVACGHAGRISPFGGNSKLFWKVDWAAKWIVIGVDVEGAGKDHSTKGGSRDVAKHIVKEMASVTNLRSIFHMSSSLSAAKRCRRQKVVVRVRKT